MTPLLLCCAVSLTGNVIVLGLCALYLRRIAQEARAIRLVLQARWDYDRISGMVSILAPSSFLGEDSTPTNGQKFRLHALNFP